METNKGILIEQLGYQYLEQFRMYASQHQVEIEQSGLLDYLTNNRVYIGLNLDQIVGCLIIDNNGQQTLWGELNRDAYNQVVSSSAVSL